MILDRVNFAYQIIESILKISDGTETIITVSSDGYVKGAIKRRNEMYDDFSFKFIFNIFDRDIKMRCSLMYKTPLSENGKWVIKSSTIPLTEAIGPRVHRHICNKIIETRVKGIITKSRFFKNKKLMRTINTELNLLFSRTDDFLLITKGDYGYEVMKNSGLIDRYIA